MYIRWGNGSPLRIGNMGPWINLKWPSESDLNWSKIYIYFAQSTNEIPQNIYFLLSEIAQFFSIFSTNYISQNKYIKNILNLSDLIGWKKKVFSSNLIGILIKQKSA